MLDLLFPPRCVLCDRAGIALCDDCVARLSPPTSRTPPQGIDSLVAVCSYDDAGRDLVLALKRLNRRSAVGILAASAAEALCNGPLARSPSGEPSAAPPTITWAPTTQYRRRRRGFDQSRLLARAAARATGWPSARLLERVGTAQSGLDRAARLGRKMFGTVGPSPASVVVVDDVITSGATLSAAANVLRRAGATQVFALVIASA